MNRRFLQLAVLSLVLSFLLGLGMAMTHNFALRSVHVHIGLTGWMSMGLFAVIYRLWPQLESGWLAKVHLLLYATGFPVSMVGLTLLMTASPKLGEPLAAVGSVLCVLAVLCFAVQVLRHLAAGGPEPR